MNIINADVFDGLKTIPDNHVQTVVTSPPYWGLRDYKAEGQIGLEDTPDEYISRLVDVFREVRRVLKPEGTVWLNLGDAYAGGHRGGSNKQSEGTLRGPAHSFRRDRMAREDEPHKGAAWVKPKDLLGMPWRVAFAIQSDGWYLRADIIWSKPNPMPESVMDRPTRSHEYLFLLAKSSRYYYDAAAIAEPLAETSVTRYELANGREGNAPCNGEYKGGEGRGSSRGQHADHLVLGGKKQADSGRRYAGFNERYIPPDKRNRRSVWTIPTQAFTGAHFATFPEALVFPCIMAGSRGGDIVLDPFSGSGTTGIVALANGREYIGIELNAAYAEMSRRRIEAEVGLLCAGAVK